MLRAQGPHADPNHLLSSLHPAQGRRPPARGPATNSGSERTSEASWPTRTLPARPTSTKVERNGPSRCQQRLRQALLSAPFRLTSHHPRHKPPTRPSTTNLSRTPGVPSSMAGATPLSAEWPCAVGAPLNSWRRSSAGPASSHRASGSVYTRGPGCTGIVLREALRRASRTQTAGSGPSCNRATPKGSPTVRTQTQQQHRTTTESQLGARRTRDPRTTAMNKPPMIRGSDLFSRNTSTLCKTMGRAAWLTYAPTTTRTQAPMHNATKETSRRTI